MAVFDAPGADPCVSGSHWGWPDTKSAFGRTQTLAVQAPGQLAVGPRPAKRGCRSGRRGRAWERPPSLGCLYRHRGGPTWTTAMPPSTGVSPTPSVLCSKAVEPGGAAEHVRHALTETDMPDGWFTPGPSPSARGAGASFLRPALGVTILRVVFQMRRSAAGDARPSTRHLKTEEGLVKQSVSIIGDAKIVGTVTVGGLPVRDATVRAEGPLPVGSDQEPLKWGTRVDADAFAVMTEIKDALDRDDVALLAAAVSRDRVGVSAEFIPDGGRIDLILPCDPSVAYQTIPVLPRVNAELTEALRAASGVITTL